MLFAGVKAKKIARCDEPKEQRASILIGGAELGLLVLTAPLQSHLAAE